MKTLKKELGLIGGISLGRFSNSSSLIQKWKLFEKQAKRREVLLALGFLSLQREFCKLQSLLGRHWLSGQHVQ